MCLMITPCHRVAGKWISTAVESELSIGHWAGAGAASERGRRPINGESVDVCEQNPGGACASHQRPNEGGRRCEERDAHAQGRRNQRDISMSKDCRHSPRLSETSKIISSSSDTLRRGRLLAQPSTGDVGVLWSVSEERRWRCRMCLPGRPKLREIEAKGNSRMSYHNKSFVGNFARRGSGRRRIGDG